jgi:ketosteroid isomerase-like protein
MKRIIAIKTGMLFIAAMFAAVTTHAQQTARDYQSQIEELNKEMARNMIEGNTEKNLSMYTDDAISMPSNEPMQEGIDAIRKGAQQMSDAGVKITSFEPTTLKVIPEGNLITEIGTYKIRVNMPGMDQPVNDHGKYLTIWEKQPDGSLKVKVETWNSDVNPMENMEQK